MRPIHRIAVAASCGLLTLASWPCPATLAQDPAPQAAAATPKAPASSSAKARKTTNPTKAAKAPKPKKLTPAEIKTAAAVAQARQLMASSKREEVEAGIQSLGLLGGAAAVAPLQERIRQGLPPELLEAAIVTLMALSQPEAGPVLFELTTHRRPEIRLRAIEALVATAPPGADSTLTTALSDSDPKVRAAAATGLGELKAVGSLEKLFLSLDRGNMEASGAIGKVLAPGDVRRLLGYLGQIPFHSLAAALGEVLKRKDVPESAKLEIVARLEDTGTREVKTYLADLVASSGTELPQPVSRAMLRAMQEIAE